MINSRTGKAASRGESKELSFGNRAVSNVSEIGPFVESVALKREAVTAKQSIEPDPAVGYLFMDRLRKSKDVSSIRVHNQSMIAAKQLINVLNPPKTSIADRNYISKKLKGNPASFAPLSTNTSPVLAFRNQFLNTRSPISTGQRESISVMNHLRIPTQGSEMSRCISSQSPIFPNDSQLMHHTGALKSQALATS